MKFRINRLFSAACLLTAVLLDAVSAAPVTVRSLEELMPYLSRDKVEVVMAPGEYWIRGADAKAGKFGSDTFQDWCKTLLPFSGSDSTYDFTGVTLKVETSVFQSLGKYDIFEVQTTGNNIVIKNLKIEDVGSVYDAPTKGALGIVIDGAHNRIEGVHLSTKGSYPYGYGEAFGKGGQNVVRHMKHCGVLVRGFANHVKDCTIIHRCFGHALFMQGADQPLIEGCYIEGEMVETDDILAEKGTGSIADKVNFMTYFGYPIPPGYAMCSGEEGIRAYDGGQTWIDGEIINRRAMNPTILNCTVKNMRGGVTLTHAGGKKYVEGTTAIGCTRGFAIGSGDIVDCYADTSYGPALGVDYERDSGMNAEITLLPNEGGVNGQHRAAYIVGRNHNITFRSREPIADQSLFIQVGGDKRNIGSLASTENYAARNITFNNLTSVPMRLGERVEECTIVTGGLVTDEGRNNRVRHEPQPVCETAVEDSAQAVLTVPGGGTYFLEYETAPSTGGVVRVLHNGTELEAVRLPAGGGTVRSAAPLRLSGGKQQLQLAPASAAPAVKQIRLLLEYPETPVVPFLEIISSVEVPLGREARSDATVFPGQTVRLEPQPKEGGRWRWTGPNGFSSDQRVVELSVLTENRSGTYTAEYTNPAGYTAAQDFEIRVTDTFEAEAAGSGEYPIRIPYPAQYIIGSRVPPDQSGSVRVELDGREIDRAAFKAVKTSEETVTASSRKAVYLKAGDYVLQVKTEPAGLAVDGLMLKAWAFVTPAELPLARVGDAHTLLAEVLDISGMPPVDVHVVSEGRGGVSRAFYQLDGGKRQALKKRKGRDGTVVWSARGLSGTTLKVMTGKYHDNAAGVYVLESADPFAQIEAEKYAEARGTRQEETRDAGGGMNIGSIKPGDWLKFECLDLTDARRVSFRTANIADGGSVEVRLDAPDGRKIAAAAIPKTGGWQHWETVSAPLAETGGLHDVYLVFGGESSAGNINWFRFSPE